MVGATFVALLAASLVDAAVLTAPGWLLPASHLSTDGDTSVQFLQVGASWAAAAAEPKLELLDAESQAARLERAYPIAWVHIPKCGSSLNNFMIHLPGTCPGVPEDLVISAETFGASHNLVFKQMYDPLGLHRHGACGEDHFYSWGNHRGVGRKWQKHYEGHGFIMLRQPEQRILSGYHYAFHSWPKVTPPANEREYAEVLQGCAVRMLVRGGREPCGGSIGWALTWTEVKEATRRLRTGFAFVGLTDEWPLSICLGHRMFGGRCRLSDFVDGRVTDREAESEGAFKKVKTTVLEKAVPYNTSVLHGFRDPYDGALYEVAQDVFRDEMLRFGVSKVSCQPCFEEAGVFLKD